MPPKYFVFLDGEQKGPFSLDQLARLGVKPSTYVWCKGMADWQRADSVEEIRNSFKNRIAPPQEITVPQPAATGPIPQREEKKETPPPARFGFPIRENEPEPDINRPPQVSMALAVLSLIFCFPPGGIAAVIFAYKANKSWENSFKAQSKEEMENLRRQSHEFERLAKMWLGLTVAFGIIFWTLIFSVKK